MEPVTFSYRSTFKRLFLPKNKDKKYSLEGVEETESSVAGNVVLEAATMKKNLEGWSPTASAPGRGPQACGWSPGRASGTGLQGWSRPPRALYSCGTPACRGVGSWLSRG